MTRILLPTDFSENSWNAIQYGLKLFQHSKCTFYLLHINPLPPYSGAGSSVRSSTRVLKDTMVVENKHVLEDLVLRIKDLPFKTNHKFITISIYDYLVAAIKREVLDKQIELIIMGTKGATGLKKITLGSNTGAVMTKVQCPLLAVPENARFTKIREIAFPTDYHIGYNLKVLDMLIAMITGNDAVLRILHISKRNEALTEEQTRNKDFLDEYLMDVNHEFHRLTGTKLETSVQCFAESRDIDMIAMVAKNLNFFQRILFRPAVEEISYHTDIPFLVLHE